MDVTPLIPKNAKIIKAYGDGIFRINEEKMAGAIMVKKESCEKWFPNQKDPFSIFEENESFFKDIEIVLFGTGKMQKLISFKILEQIRQKHGFSVEIMSTGAACRTYNILLAEGRNVAALLDVGG